MGGGRIARELGRAEMRRLRVLDLYCGGGGAARGILAAARAAEVEVELTGIDRCLRGSPRQMRDAYPGRYVLGDALAPPVNLARFDLVWASPPCQHASAATRWQSTPPRRAHPDLIGPTREMLKHAGVHYAMENVPRARLRPDIRLTGPAVGLPRIERLRHIEISWDPPRLPPPARLPRGAFARLEAVTITRSMSCPSHFYPRCRAGLRGRLTKREACEAMGLGADGLSMTLDQIGEAVPPAYAYMVFTHYLEVVA